MTKINKMPLKFLYRSIIPAVLLLFAVQISAQQDVKVPRSSFKVTSQGFTEAYKHLRDGDAWARKGIGAIPLALKDYLKAAEYNPACPELNLKIGMSYLQSDHKSQAVDYLKKAYEKNPAVSKDIQFLLARAYHYNMEFDHAIEFYTKYFKSLKKRDQQKRSAEINKYIDECNSGKELLAAPQRVVIKDLGPAINSSYDDYNEVFTGNDSIMYFSSRRPSGKRPKPGRLDYKYDEDIYIAKKGQTGWDTAKYLTDGGFNTKHHEDVIWVADKGKTLYIYNGYKKNGDIMLAHFKDGKWSGEKKLRGGFNSDLSETSMSITGDGNTMYFISNDPREGFGGKDIYYARKNARGKWDEPHNIGSVLNTRYDEESVYVTPDGNELYFCSKGHNSMGGYDVFKSERDENGNWQKPVNLGFPINTPDDELFYRTGSVQKSAYYSAKRAGGLGGFDIYQIIYLGSEKEMMLDSEEQLVAYFEKPISDIFSKMPEEMKIDTTIILKGIITDAKDNKPLMAKLDLIDQERSQVIATVISDSTGAYQVKLPEVKNYGIEINAKNYMFFLDVLNLPPKIDTREIIRNFKLSRVEVGSKVVLKNIYFETGKAVLTPESNTELDKVVKFLQENTDLKIEISGHTDNVGSLKYNTRLSEARAKAVVDYFVAHGIPQERLVYKGYGFSQPIAPNTTPEGRQLNRRVEFKILSKQ